LAEQVACCTCSALMIADLPLPFAPLMKVMWRLRKAQACRKSHAECGILAERHAQHTRIHLSRTERFVFNLCFHHAGGKACHRCFGPSRAISQALNDPQRPDKNKICKAQNARPKPRFRNMGSVHRQLVLRAPKLDLKVVMALEGFHAHALHMPCL